MAYENVMQLSKIPSPVVEDDKFLFVGLTAYHAMTAEELSFDKGERLRVSIYFIIY